MKYYRALSDADPMERKYETADRIMEYGIYAYIVLMFLARGEGIRNIIIFGNFGLWLLTLRYRDNLQILKSPVSVLCWIYVLVSLFSVVFSINPFLSLKVFKGGILKFALLYPVIATVMTRRTRLENAAATSFFTMIFIVGVAYYSFIFRDLEVLKPDTWLVHAWHNKFAQYVNTLLPISFILFFTWRRYVLRGVLAVSFFVSILALIFSTSRGGYIAFLAIAFIWSFYLSKSRGFNLKKIVAYFMIGISIAAVCAFFYSSDVRKRLLLISTQIYSFNERTEIWSAAGYAIARRPLLGWGLGDSIFHLDEPYRGTPFDMKPPVKGPHNMLIEVMFHQGIIGLVPFITLIVYAAVIFWRDAFSVEGVRNYMLVACVTILAGNYIIHNFLESINKVEHLAVVLGLGMAAIGIHEDSGT